MGGQWRPSWASVAMEGSTNSGLVTEQLQIKRLSAHVSCLLDGTPGPPSRPTGFPPPIIYNSHHQHIQRFDFSVLIPHLELKQKILTPTYATWRIARVIFWFCQGIQNIGQLLSGWKFPCWSQISSHNSMMESGIIMENLHSWALALLMSIGVYFGIHFTFLANFTFPSTSFCSSHTSYIVNSYDSWIFWAVSHYEKDYEHYRPWTYPFIFKFCPISLKCKTWHKHGKFPSQVALVRLNV